MRAGRDIVKLRRICAMAIAVTVTPPLVRSERGSDAIALIGTSMQKTIPSRDAELTFRRVSAQTVNEVCDLSETLSDDQRNMVADNSNSIAEAHFSDNAWFRAIYADETMIGFVMLHIGADHDDGIRCPGAFLWRFMIAGAYQGRGFGRRAIELLVSDLRARGFSDLTLSYSVGPGSPEPFYRRLGFVATGGRYDEEHEAVLRFAG